MPFDDRMPDGSAVRSLSEQLRDLEAQLGHEHDLSLPRVARRTKLPTHLGRPIGLTRPDGFPRIARLIADPDARAFQPEPRPSRGATFRRGVTVVGVGLLLLASTAIVPPLLVRRPVPEATQLPIPDRVVTSQRTERFAQSARELRDAKPGAVSSPTPAQPILARVAVAPHPARPTITLSVSDNESARLDLPTIVTGMGSASPGSAVVIDGLPAGTRVSHGIPIARESWTVASADVATSVVFLPRDAPERVDLLVRVIAADSQELAASALEIRVLRTTDVTAPIDPASGGTTALRSMSQPTARYEPTAAEGEAAPDAMFPPPSHKPAAPRSARAPAWPTATSAWTRTAQDAAPPATLARPPPWMPFR